MKLMTYNPNKTLQDFFNGDMEPFFSRNLIDFFNPETVRAIHPKVNIVENENEFLLTAEVPGMVDDDIDVEIKDGVLSLRGHVKEEKETQEDNYRIKEFRSQNFERSFRLGEQVDPEKVAAKLEKGILRVSLGKKEIAKPRKVAINIGS
ncbi:MAG: Hsp20/alpha crystallin family protein [Nitrospinae bacterium]|nr:Hsp20/alpha crystallin family protein [Nitrospinota bacterium]